MSLSFQTSGILSVASVVYQVQGIDDLITKSSKPLGLVRDKHGGSDLFPSIIRRIKVQH